MLWGLLSLIGFLALRSLDAKRGRGAPFRGCLMQMGMMQGRDFNVLSYYACSVVSVLFVHG